MAQAAWLRMSCHTGVHGSSLLSRAALSPHPCLPSPRSSEPGGKGLSWAPTDTINAYAARPASKAVQALDVGIKGGKYLGTIGHDPTGRLKDPKGSNENNETKRRATGTPGPQYEVMTKLDAPTSRFGHALQRPQDGKVDGVPTHLSPGPIYDRPDKLGKRFAHTFENAPSYPMGVKLRGDAIDAIFSPRTAAYEGPLGTLPSRSGTHDRSAKPSAGVAYAKGSAKTHDLPDGLGKQVEGKKTSAPLYQFGKETQRPTKPLFQGKECEDVFRGKDSLQVPVFTAHSTGFYRSPRLMNSPRFTMSKEQRF